MSLQHTPTLATDLSKSYILLDSTALIDASRSDDFLNLLSSISEKGCSLITIPSVVYEFTRNANNIEGYNERQEFIKGLNITVLNRIEEILEKEQVFKIAYAKAFGSKDKGPSYTDALLCTVAYKHRGHGMMLMTAITIDIGGELRIEAIYRLSPNKLNKVIEAIH